jgi:hypothetical protein
MTQNKTAHSAPMTLIPVGAGEWKEYHGEVYRCRVYLTPGPQGSVVATAAGLYSITGAGATEADALASVTQALSAHGKRPSPDSQTEEPPASASVRWVVVHP